MNKSSDFKLVHLGGVCSASLHAFKNEDISVGSWMLGLDIEHVDDRSFCCVASLPGSLPKLFNHKF